MFALMIENRIKIVYGNIRRQLRPIRTFHAGQRNYLPERPIHLGQNVICLQSF